MATVQDLQDKIDTIMVPGQAVVLDLAQLTFLDSSAIHCFVRAEAESGHAVVLLMRRRRCDGSLTCQVSIPKPGSFTDKAQVSGLGVATRSRPRRAHR
jgi:STAS domain